MKAMILAAGLGTRLRPLTDDRPKALVEVAGRTLVEITLSRLREFGIREVMINAHHFADLVLDYLETNHNFGMRLEVSREDLLLDTGGGLKKAGYFFLEDPNHLEEPFLLHNVDVLSTIDLGRMVQFHTENQALATLAVQHRQSSRQLLFDEQLRLSGRRSGGNQATAVLRSSPSARNEHEASGREALAFCGIHVISSRLLGMMSEDGAFSIIDCYLRLAAQGEKILAFRADESYWRDVGRPESLRQAAEDLHKISAGGASENSPGRSPG